TRIVSACRLVHVEMVDYGIFQSSERTVVKKRRCNGEVSERGGPELVAIRREAGNLLEAKVLVPPRAVEDDVSRSRVEPGGNLWRSGDVILQIGEHLAGAAGDGMTGHALRPAEEEQRAALFGRGHRVVVAARKSINRRVGEREGELEFGDGGAEHREV